MRNLIFKNLTSSDRRRRVIASTEITEKRGIHSVIRRHFVCIIKEVQKVQPERPASYLYILKYRNTKERKEKYLCRIKGSVCAESKGKLFLVLYMHSLNIDLSAVSHNWAEDSASGR